MKVIVDKAFMLRGERQEPGSVVEVDPGLAQQLITMQRAHLAPDEPSAPADQPKTMTTDSVGGLVGGIKKQKGP